MMKSMQPMMSRHNNSEQQPTLDRTPVNARPSITQRSTERYTNHTTGFARRALLLLMFLVAYVGSVWGQEKILWNNGPADPVTINDIPDVFTTSDGIILRVYGNSSMADIRIVTTHYTQFLDKERYNLYDDPEYYDDAKGCFKFELNNTASSLLAADGLFLDVEWSGGQITKITYEIPDNFVGSLKSDSKDQQYSDSKFIDDISTTSMPIDLSKAFAMVQDATYVRIYLEKGGEAVDPTGKLTGLGELNCPTPEHGYYIYKIDEIAEDDLPTVTLTLPAGEFEDYQVVTVWSTDKKASLPDKEPDWDLQYVYAFEYPFKGDATSATQMESTFKVPMSLQSSDMTLSFDYANSVVKLVRNSNEVVAEAPIDPKFLNAYSDASAQLTNNFYIRWFLQRNGVEIYSSGALSDATGGIYQTPAKERYYYYWNAEKDNSGKALNDVLKINLNSSILSPLTDYDLVFTIANNTNGATYDGSGKLAHEPNTMAYQYTFHFIDKPFEAENISTVKTIYKTALYDKAASKITTQLFVNYNEIMSDLQTDRETFNTNAYLRWYVTDVSGQLVSDMASWNFETEGTFTKNDTYGYYREYGFYEYESSKFDPIVTLPDGYDYKDYQIVCVVTMDKTGISLPDNEPTNMQVKYVFSQFFTKEELDALPFVHYKGYSGRDWVTPEGSTGNMTQKYWANDVDGAVDITADIRQGVHTWEYDIYALPNEERQLILPFQYYTEGTGQDDEPRGYIRWYDWKTDAKVVEHNFTFTKEESKGASFLDENDRGLFALCKSVNLHQYNIGVNFTPNANFSESIDIACDVSKYSDGIVNVDGKYYLLHEPTLSNRYIFHIRPASESAKDLKEAKETLEKAEADYKAGGKAQDLFNAMSTLREDKGKVVVSLGNNMIGEFALRLDHHNLLSYVIENSSGNYVSATGIQWYAYFENDKGIWRKQLDYTTDNRIKTFKYSDFQGIFSILKGTLSQNFENEKKFHVVGYVGDSNFDVVNGTGLYFPVVHYELHFIEAPPILMSNLISGNVSDEYVNRLTTYMEDHYEQAGVVDFDGNPKTNPNIVGNEAQYYSTQNWNDAPTSSADNSAYEPFPWDDIQYGFCYPMLTQTIRNGYHSQNQHFVSPEHGDYIVLKSMNVSGISNNYLSGSTPPYDYHTWDKTPIYDYTYYETNGKQYGSFLYTDASDESRIIATIPFTANLCKGSSIYFTAAVADMTDWEVNPQLLIRIVGIDGNNRRRIVAFHTGDIGVAGAGRGEWYQVYGVSTVPTDFDTSLTRFEAEIINYAKDTKGADFAIDQIVIYTSTAEVLLTQTGNGACGDDEENIVKVYMKAEGLQNAFDVTPELQPVYWRICDKETGKVVKGPGMYPRYDQDGTLISSDDEGKNSYGVSWVKSSFSDADLDQIAPNHPYGWYKVGDDEYFFQIAEQSFGALERGKDYYVSVYEPRTDFNDSEESNWGGLYFGARSKCSIYSDFFIPRRQYVAYIVDAETGKEGGEITIPCGSTNGAEVKGVQMVLKVPDSSNKITGYKDYYISFDYIISSMDKWNSNAKLGNGTDYTYINLRDALKDYRETYPNENGLISEYAKTVEGIDYRAVLEYAINEKLLLLDNLSKFTHTFIKAGTYHVICQPTMSTIEDKDICGPFEVIFKLKESGGPSLTLGFDDVTYDGHGNIRVVRVGLQQLRNMQASSNGYLLHIPVNKFMTDADDKATLNKGTLTIISPSLELLKYDSDNVTNAADDTMTNDPDVPHVPESDTDSAPIYVATFEGTEISSSRQYISLNFGITTSNAYKNFKEGFTYRMFFQVKDKEKINDATACEAGVEFLMKVVPEYVTWNDEGKEVTPNSNDNTNWNNDANWSRSKKKELYSSSYKDNSDMNITSTPAAFVPMKFTYVTIPSNNKAPVLENLTIGDDGIYNNIKGTGATDNIEYDLMVRMEETCLDEGHSEKGTTNIYDCEKFYGNWAKEIYFKPEAELVKQHYLTYEKVWVEKELTAGKWYLMSTPLQNTYAGDMYVPTTGRQETEAFKDIEFNTTNYSRTAYPIYQKSWLQEGSKVYTTTNDIRQTDYSANLVGSVSETLSLWSHTYNDVQVNYSQWKGFAIRAHKSDYNGTRNNALLRLPKEDTDYDYYQWNGTIPTDGMDAQAVDKKATDGTHLATGKLFTDGTPNTYGLTYGVDYIEKNTRTAGDGEISVSIGEVQDAKTYPNNIADYYLLVGNPYLCSINMEKFLDANKNVLTNAYWTYEHNTIEIPYTKGSIKPLQSFFVKLKEEITDGDKTITFTPDMMMDGNTAPIIPAARTMMMTATNDRGQSTATVSVGEKAQSIETLFDSNLADVPMVYTVANGQAVSVNQMTELDRPIAFGVTCSSNEPVSVTFSDVAQLTSGEVWVVDAVTGELTTVTEGCAVSVQPNDYSRYFLLAGALNIGDKADVQQGIMVSVRDRMVTVTSGEELTSVHVMSPDGTTVRQHTGGGTTASFVLSPGVYVIKAENIACEQQTVKVIVK